MDIRRSRMMIFAVALIAMVTVVVFQSNSILTALGGLRR
jgi:hypothetical protein